MSLVEIGKIYFMDYTNIKSNEANTPMNIKELHGYIKKNRVSWEVVVHIFNPTTCKVEQVDLGVQGQSGLQTEFSDS